MTSQISELSQVKVFDTVLEDVPVAALIADSDGIIVWANRAIMTMFGHRRQAILGASVETLIPPERRINHAGRIAEWFRHPRARPMGNQNLQIQGWTAAGEVIDLSIQLQPIELPSSIIALAWIRLGGEE